MRRLVPWALAGLVFLGAGAAAGLALNSDQSTSGRLTPAMQWAESVLGRTEMAGSARFTYLETASSLDGVTSRILGSGAIDFRNGSIKVTELEDINGLSKQPEIVPPVPDSLLIREDYVVIGRTFFETIASKGSPTETTEEFRPASRNPLAGLSLAGDAGLALQSLDGQRRTTGLVKVRATMADDTAAELYRVTSKLTCMEPLLVPVRVTVGPTLVWIDRRGRLIKVADTVHATGHLPAPPKPGQPGLYVQVPQSVTITMQLSSFGAPVHITAPEVKGGPSGTAHTQLPCPP